DQSLPEEIPIRCLLCSFTTFASLYQGKHVHAYALKMGLDVDVTVCNTLITMYTNCLDLSAAFNIFDEMTSNWIKFLECNSNKDVQGHNRPMTLWRFLKLMHTSEYKIDHITRQWIKSGFDAGHFGYGEEALKLFETMRSAGIKPNNVTFVGVSLACSHVGLVEEGCNYYKIMESDCGIRPTREHCCCVVDMLARLWES
ncbi:hypothetical protein IFM89_014013, partial [Coptis chinensis]